MRDMAVHILTSLSSLFVPEFLFISSCLSRSHALPLNPCVQGIISMAVHVLKSHALSSAHEFWLHEFPPFHLIFFFL